MVNLFHFSPCGTTEKCAKLILEGMGETAKSVDLLSPEVAKAGPADVSIVAFPVYGGHVAPVILERLDIALEEAGKAVGIVVYGNRDYENALNEIHEYLTGRGFEVVALVGAVAQHSLCAKIGAGRPDAEDASALKYIGVQIAEKLGTNDEVPLEFPKAPDIKPYALGVSPLTNEDCIACGICADECPTQVIEVDDEAVSPAQCLGCTLCIQVCPEDARELPAEAAAMIEQFLSATASERRKPELFI